MKYSFILLLAGIFSISCVNQERKNFVFLDNGTLLNSIDSMIYVWIPPGETTINETANVNGDKTLILKVVSIDEGFWMSNTEVTVGQFKSFVNQTGFVTDAEKFGNKFNWRFPGFSQGPNHPVVYISINDAKKYLKWSMCSLPSQEEWIYAAKANATTNYYWGDEFSQDYLWYRMNASAGSKPVGTKLPNNWDLHDMIGNVYEYVSICDTTYFTMGASWSRCDGYSSHIPGEMVHLNTGNIKKMN